MKNLIVEKTEVKLNDEDKIKNFIEESKSNDGVIIKIKNNVYRHLIDKDGRCFTKNITPIFEFTSEDELETILKTQIKIETNDSTPNKYVGESTTEKENPLKRPSAHSLIDIFKELKFGRPAADQKYLAKCIVELEQVDEDTDYEDTDYGPVLTINKNSIESELEEQPPNYITKTIKSFVSVGDVIEVEHHGKNVIYRVDQFEVIPNSPELRPIDFVILVTFSSSHGGSITCTSNNFKYIRHMNIDKDWCSYEEPHLDYSSGEKLPNVTLNSLVEKGEEELIQGMDKTIIDSSKLRPYNRINVLSSQEGKMSMDDLEEELTKIVFKYASSHMMKKDLELSIKIMGDVIRHPQFYLNI